MLCDRDDPRRYLARELDDGDARIVGVDRQPRHHGDADAGPDEPLHGRVVVRAERPVRLDSLRPERGNRPGRRSGCRGTRRAAARRSRCNVGRVRASRESAATISTYGSRNSSVSSSGASPTGGTTNPTSSWPRSIAADDLLVLELVEHHLDLRPLLREAPHQLRQHSRTDRLERTDGERARFARLQARGGRPEPPAGARRSTPRAAAAEPRPRSGRPGAAHPDARPGARRRCAPESRSAG